MLIAFLRGDALQNAADATMRAVLIPIRMRQLLASPAGATRRQLLVLAAKHAAIEGSCVVARFVATGVGAPFAPRCSAT